MQPSEKASLSSNDLAASFAATRQLTEDLAAPLSDADATLQSMEDASPTKWHLAHVTWFWETFLLRDHLRGYERFNADYPFLFNSYYEAEGERIGRFARGMLSRPSLDEILEWRSAVDAAMADLLDDPKHVDLIQLGIAHEQQHQELLLTDIKHALFQNPLGPAMFEGSPEKANAPEKDWHEHPGGIAQIGHAGNGFAFDNEGPRHRALLEPFALAKSLVTNAEWAEFIADGGYQNAALWLSDGWAWLNENQVSAPLYWRERDEKGEHFTHQGWQNRDPNAPVTHISYFEADAFASWAGQNEQGVRLPTEFEWEAIGQGQDAGAGNQVDASSAPLPKGSSSLFGDCWQFTRSAYLPYPRFKPASGAVGEYNGKFMSGQFVLKGASCATARGHSRASYRNFFYPHQRWQFTGLRLAKDI
ncbi:MAG: ergothioneine biosynthesis protein EgtB [Erythrobacter sp.]